jgi:hypothetical protein
MKGFVLLLHRLVAIALEPKNNDDTATTIRRIPNFLATELCSSFCTGKCCTYQTPIHTCFNGMTLFNHSVDWGTMDILDTISRLEGDDDDPPIYFLTRQFYESNTSMCQELFDTYELPLNECVGPFGKPHPWGRFTLVNDNKKNTTENTNVE